MLTPSELSNTQPRTFIEPISEEKIARAVAIIGKMHQAFNSAYYNLNIWKNKNYKQQLAELLDEMSVGEIDEFRRHLETTNQILNLEHVTKKWLISVLVFAAGIGGFVNDPHFGERFLLCFIGLWAMKEMVQSQKKTVCGEALLFT